MARLGSTGDAARASPEMSRREVDVTRSGSLAEKSPDQIDDLDLLDPNLLRRRWRSVTGRPLPPGLSRPLAIRILQWREQIALVGDLDAATQTRLDTAIKVASQQAAVAGSSATPARRLRAGSVLVREHAGVLHRVMALPDGFAWYGQTFCSLSSVARAITGTSWNGRRFFSLDKPSNNEAGQRSKSSKSRPANTAARVKTASTVAALAPDRREQEGGR